MPSKCSKKDVCMTASEAITEHEKLVRVLRGGEKSKLQAMAEDQAEELKGYRKKARKYGRLGKRDSSRGK